MPTNTGAPWTIPYPLATDPNNVPVDMQAMANAVAAGLTWAGSATLTAAQIDALTGADRFTGRMVYQSDTDANTASTHRPPGTYIYNGTAWRRDWNVAWGEPMGGYVAATSDQTGITTVIDLAGLSITFTAVAGRRYKVTGRSALQSTVAADEADVQLTDSTNTVLTLGRVTCSKINASQPATIDIDLTASGAVTWKLRVVRSAGTGTVSAFQRSNLPAFLRVEDVGPVPGAVPA